MGSEHSREFRQALEDATKAMDRGNDRQFREASGRLSNINERAAQRAIRDMQEEHEERGEKRPSQGGPCADQAMMMISLVTVAVVSVKFVASRLKRRK